MTISVQAGGTATPLPPPYVGPFDILGAARTFWGLRGYSAAGIPNVCCAVTRAVGIPSQQNFNAVAGGLVDIAAITTFLTGTTGVQSVWFDQTGGGRQLSSRAGGVSYPTFVILDATNKPCIRMLRASKQGFQANAFDTLVQPFTFIGVAVNNNAAGDNAVYFGSNQQGITPQNFGAGFTGNQDAAFMTAGNNLTNPNALHGVLFDYVAVYNGASSRLDINGITVSGNAGSANIGNNIYTIGGDGVGNHDWTGDGKEAGIYARVITPTESAAYHAQCSAFWGY